MSGRTKNGSSMSAKQIAHAVKDHRLVTFHFGLSTGLSISGWVCGMDDYHWKIVTLDAKVMLVHKGLVPLVEIHELDYSPWADQPEQIKKIVEPFHQWVMREFFSQGGEK